MTESVQAEDPQRKRRRKNPETVRAADLLFHGLVKAADVKIIVVAPKLKERKRFSVSRIFP